MLELLVVLIILLMITAAAIPVMTPALQNRRMREAARVASTFISGARSRAIQTGREVGVQVQRFNGNPWASSLSYVEVPPPYGGDTLASRMLVPRLPLQGNVQSASNNGNNEIRITLSGSLNPALMPETGFEATVSGVGGMPISASADGRWTIEVINSTTFDLKGSTFGGSYNPSGTIIIHSWPVVDAFTAGDTAWRGSLRYGDQVRLDAKGPLYTLVSEPLPDIVSMYNGIDPRAGQAITTTPGSGTPPFWFLVDPHGLTPNLPAGYGAPPGVPFQVFRQPIRSSDTPVQLPDGIVIDLLYSGMGLSNSEPFHSQDAVAKPPQPWPPNWSANWPTNPPAPFDPIITFTPNGAVGHVTTLRSMRPNGPIYLLLGRRELMPDVALEAGTTTPEDKNIYDSDPPATEPENQYLNNFWITIGYQTGLVTVTENARNLGPVNDPTTYLLNARSIARTAQSVGGQ